MKPTDITDLFKKFNKMNIVVIGDVMVDAYMWGNVERISPEAPIPVVSVTERENRLGGAANVALNLRAMGANPILCSVIGEDDKTGLFMELMDENRLEKAGILTSVKRKTTVKTRIISNQQHLLRIDEESIGKIDSKSEKDFLNLLTTIITTRKPDAIIFEDYDKGVITPAVIKDIIEIAKLNNIEVAADPKNLNFKNYKNIDLFKPNLKELAEGLKTDIHKNSFESIENGAKKLQELSAIKYLLVTLSELGIYIRYNNNGELFPAVAKEVADVSGAGDTVISVATLCMAAGCNPYDFARIANLAGTQVCEKVGVVTVNKERLLEDTITLFTGK